MPYAYLAILIVHFLLQNMAWPISITCGTLSNQRLLADQYGCETVDFRILHNDARVVPTASDEETAVELQLVHIN